MLACHNTCCSTCGRMRCSHCISTIIGPEETSKPIPTKYTPTKYSVSRMKNDQTNPQLSNPPTILKTVQKGNLGEKSLPPPNSLSPDAPLHLSDSTSFMIYKWLESLQKESYYEIIVQACENALQDQMKNAGDKTSKTTSTTPISTKPTESQTRQHKRKIRKISGGIDENLGTPSVETENSLEEAQKPPKFACHFYIMNQYLYSSCGNTGFRQLCHLLEHLRKKHCLKQHSCGVCWRPFDSVEGLQAHIDNASDNTCRATGGIPINELIIPRKHMGDDDKWDWIWDNLFRLFPRPKSRYWEPLDHNEQLFMNFRHFMSKQLAQVLSPTERRVVMDKFTRFCENWVANPPEPGHVMQFDDGDDDHNSNRNLSCRAPPSHDKSSTNQGSSLSNIPEIRAGYSLIVPSHLPNDFQDNNVHQESPGATMSLPSNVGLDAERLQDHEGDFFLTQFVSPGEYSIPRGSPSLFD